MKIRKAKKFILILVLCLLFTLAEPFVLSEDLGASAAESTSSASQQTTTYIDESEETTATSSGTSTSTSALSGESTSNQTVTTATPVTEETEKPAQTTETATPTQTQTTTDTSDKSGSAVASGVTNTATPTPTATTEQESTEKEETAAATQSKTESTSGSKTTSTAASGSKVQSKVSATSGTAAATSGSTAISTNTEYSSQTFKSDFRFWTVVRKYAFAEKSMNVYEDMDEESRVVGTLVLDGVCYILKEEEDGWDYIESGDVRGFVKDEDLLYGEDAEEMLEEAQQEAQELAEEMDVDYTGIEMVVPVAEEKVSRMENEAFTYLRATVNQTVVSKIFAQPSVELLNIYEEANADSRVVGTLEEDGILYIIEDEFNNWLYVESGDVRGFVDRSEIRTEGVKETVAEEGEENFAVAEELIEPQENEALYYTLTSVKSGVASGKLRQQIVEYASQFIGNPYVWGGTSLTEGADCSGFVQTIFAKFGYTLPRVAEDQAQYGEKIKVGDAEPGDLIFYSRNGYIYHVVMYAGNGETIEAHNRASGIIRGTVDYSRACWATRVLKEEDEFSADINEQNATPEMYGENLGEFTITYYCACEKCCDVCTGITATGAPVVQGETIAVDPSVIPYGTKVIINGHVFTAEDCGGAIKQNHIDIYVDDHETALALGVTYADVYLVND